MTVMEWAQRKRLRAHQAVIKSPESAHLKEIRDHWNEIIKALHIMTEDVTPAEEILKRIRQAEMFNNTPCPKWVYDVIEGIR